MNKKLIRITEADIHRVVRESVKKVLNEISENRVFPQDFVEHESNHIDFGDHFVCFSVREGNGELDRDDEYWIWDVRVETNKGHKQTSVFQYCDDSAKWTFYETYEWLCKKLGVVPAEML